MVNQVTDDIEKKEIYISTIVTNLRIELSINHIGTMCNQWISFFLLSIHRSTFHLGLIHKLNHIVDCLTDSIIDKLLLNSTAFDL